MKISEYIQMLSRILELGMRVTEPHLFREQQAVVGGVLQARVECVKLVRSSADAAARFALQWQP